MVGAWRIKWFVYSFYINLIRSVLLGDFVRNFSPYIEVYITFADCLPIKFLHVNFLLLVVCVLFFFFRSMSIQYKNSYLYLRHRICGVIE